MAGIFTTQPVSILPATRASAGSVQYQVNQIQAQSRGTDHEGTFQLTGDTITSLQGQVDTIMQALRRPLPLPETIAITDPNGVLIAWLGYQVVNGKTYDGIWAQNAYFGGTSPQDADIVITNSGITITNASFVIGGTAGSTIKVYDPSNVLVAELGASLAAGFSGGWFQQIRIGGASIAAPVLASDASGNVTINGATFSLTLNNVTTTIDNQIVGALTYPVGLYVQDNSGLGGFTGVTPHEITMVNNAGNTLVNIVGVSSGLIQVITYGVSTFIATLTGTHLDLGFPSVQVVTGRQAGPGAPAGFADAVAQAWALGLYNALSAAGGGHGLIN